MGDVVETQQVRIEELEKQLEAHMHDQSNLACPSPPPATHGASGGGADRDRDPGLSEARTHISLLQARVIQMEQQERDNELMRVHEREEELRERAAMTQDTDRVKASLVHAADLAEELRECHHKLQHAEKLSSQHHRRLRRALQQVKVLTDALTAAKLEIQRLSPSGANTASDEAGVEVGMGMGMRQDAGAGELVQLKKVIDLKRDAMEEQEKALVEVMRAAVNTRKAAAAAKDGQEDLLLQAVLEGSKEAFLCQQVLDREKELEEQLEYQNSIVNDLAVDHRRLNQLVVDCKAAALKVRPKGIIPLRVMGALDTSPGGVMRQAAAQGRFGTTLEENQTNAAKLAKLLRDATFHPFIKDLSDAKRPREKINRKDPRLEQVRQAFGRAVADDLVRALTELNRWNASGRYPIEIAWNDEEDREMTPAEMIECLAHELAIKPF
jgi:hypothetical protein